MLDRGRPAGAQSVAKCTNMALHLPLYSTVRKLVSLGHVAVKTRRMRTNRAEGLHFSVFHFAQHGETRERAVPV